MFSPQPTIWAVPTIIVPKRRTTVAAAGGRTVNISEDSSGLVFSDDFDRANSATVGNDWTEHETGWTISSNRLLSGPANPEHISNTNISRGEMFVQAILRSSSVQCFPNLLARFDYNGGSSNNYMVQLDIGDQFLLISRVNGANTNLDTAAANPIVDTDFVCQLYVADGVQEATADIGGDSLALSAADTDHDAQNARSAGFLRGGSSGNSTHDDFLCCTSKNISVSGLNAGESVEVRDGADATLASADPDGFGDATIDYSVFGGAADEAVPLAGAAKLVVLDAAASVIGTYDATGVFPGGSYTVTTA